MRCFVCTVKSSFNSDLYDCLMILSGGFSKSASVTRTLIILRLNAVHRRHAQSISRLQGDVRLKYLFADILFIRLNGIRRQFFFAMMKIFGNGFCRFSGICDNIARNGPAYQKRADSKRGYLQIRTSDECVEMSGTDHIYSD
jgi:hypothetical protein